MDCGLPIAYVVPDHIDAFADQVI
uniref:Uncharacterized protein n=1 Tax=Oryza barthii TaxID=65489 RepID=A0A0D3GWF4_9ORYZ